jgi:hypothetical protein
MVRVWGGTKPGYRSKNALRKSLNAKVGSSSGSKTLSPASASNDTAAGLVAEFRNVLMVPADLAKEKRQQIRQRARADSKLYQHFNALLNQPRLPFKTVQPELKCSEPQ